ncbi:Lacal_2735 family protein [Aurantibacter sp.]|uniref:Lacal_2735 family protein n=1 Tax=Aurantibacter sp. TaxID=2807103 RepID=UPI0035C84E5D
MNNPQKIVRYKEQLKDKYKVLIEQAYNFKQTDSGLSDFFEYKAIKTLNKLNRLNYLEPNS